MDLDLDLRKLRYFLSVAEQLNFGRAAEELHIAQPVLSRQIRALEQELNAQLFVRDKRRTELTPAGVQLLSDARSLLAAADAARRRVSRVARGEGSFTIGFMPGTTVSAPVRALSQAHPHLTVEVLRTSWDNQIEVLRDGRADVSLIRLPVDVNGLEVRPLFTEPRVVALPDNHRLAGKESVSITDLADEHLLQDPESVPEWRDIATELRDGTRIPGRPTNTVEEKLEHIASGFGIGVLPLSAATYYRRPDVVHAVITDIPPNQTCLAWEAARHDPLIEEFVRLAEAAQD